MDRHEHHHDLIDARARAFDAARGRYARGEAYKSVHNTVAGHLRSEHGWRRLVGPPLTLDALNAEHVRRHGAAS